MKKIILKIFLICFFFSLSANALATNTDSTAQYITMTRPAPASALAGLAAGGFIISRGDETDFAYPVKCEDRSGSACVHRVSNVTCPTGYTPQILLSPIYNESSGSYAIHGNIISKIFIINDATQGYDVWTQNAYTNLLGTTSNTPVHLQYIIYCMPIAS